MLRRGTARTDLRSAQHLAASPGVLSPPDALAAVAAMMRGVGGAAARVAALKEAADQQFARGAAGVGGAAGSLGSAPSGAEGAALLAAVQTHSEALALLPTYVSCVSNRAACLLALGRLGDCRADCSAALALMAPAATGQPTATGPLPPTGPRAARSGR